MPESVHHQTALAGYEKLVRRRLLLLVLLALGIAFTLVLNLSVGPAAVPFNEAMAALAGSGDEASRLIVWELRFPIGLMAVLVGAALALAGAEMQTTLDNPLASPFTLGMSSAAVFGAALAMVMGITVPGIPESWAVPVNAFLCALGSVLLLQTLTRARQAGPETLVLFGIALFFTFNALVSIMQYVADQQNLQQLVFWTMGSLEKASWTTVQIVAVALVAVVPFSLAASWKLTALRLGDERARSFGIDVPRLRLQSLFRVSILTATAVAFVGTIAFVGLVGPHIARLLVGEDHRFFLPASAICGALVMSLASVASKAILPGAEIPVGLVTALIGVPFFLSLVLRRRS